MILMLLALLCGAFSAWLYLRARRWPDAVLVMTAAAALAGLLGDFKRSAAPLGRLVVEPQAPLIDLRSAASIGLYGNGMSAARWRDLPARPLHWDMPRGDGLTLDFPRSVPPGAIFTLRAHIGVEGAARSGVRLQLVGAKGQLLAQSARGDAAVHWRPATAGDLLLYARVLDARGRLLARGPVPLRVEAPAPLRVQGRFAAPSFDKRALRLLLESSHALLDWQVRLAPAVLRTDAPAVSLGDPDLIVTDARWLARAGAAQRKETFDHVRRGARLLVLEEDSEPASLGKPAALTVEALGAGRIGRLQEAGWHRHAVAAPAALSWWWQGIVDRLGVARAEPLVWREMEPMPVAGRRLEVCAYGAQGQVRFPQLGQVLAWQRRPDRADAACVAVWPERAGWLRVQAGAQATRIYVYAPNDWPAWQAALDRAATRRYALRTPQPPQARMEPYPAWPFAAVFALAMLGLWWRERGAPSSMPAFSRDDPASSFSSR